MINIKADIQIYDNNALISGLFPLRRWEGGDPGVSNQKTPTTILLTPDRKFHSFGYAARDFYHDLDPSESKQWLYLEKFKMKLHTTAVRTHTHTLLTLQHTADFFHYE